MGKTPEVRLCFSGHRVGRVPTQTSLSDAPHGAPSDQCAAPRRRHVRAFCSRWPVWLAGPGGAAPSPAEAFTQCTTSISMDSRTVIYSDGYSPPVIYFLAQTVPDLTTGSSMMCSFNKPLRFFSNSSLSDTRGSRVLRTFLALGLASAISSRIPVPLVGQQPQIQDPATRCRWVSLPQPLSAQSTGRSCTRARAHAHTVSVPPPATVTYI